MTKNGNITDDKEALLPGKSEIKKKGKKKRVKNFKRNVEIDSCVKLTSKTIVEKSDQEDDEVIKIRTEKYSRGEGLDPENPGIKRGFLRKKYLNKEKNIKFSEDLAGRAEVLHGESQGFIEVEEGEKSTRFLTQAQIKKQVDITSASKQFDLRLTFGPYRLDYTPTGRHLLLGGKQGHIAAFDWITKKLLCETNVMESVFDVKWLHIETMFAVAQKNWVYVYNNQGVELHCVTDMSKPLRLEFLPYHFLLAASSESGWMEWLDVTMGKVVSAINTHKGRMPVLTQNPYNAILVSGHNNGTVCMWSPNMKKPVASMLCHNSIVQAIAIDTTGHYMATSGCHKDLKLWDIRYMSGKPLKQYKLMGGSITDLAFSQTGLLAASGGNTLQVYKNCITEEIIEPYLLHRTNTQIKNIEFSPFEDVLGLATDGGYTSMLVPGAGESNFDALEVNPMRSKSQRREAEVKSLLDKIPVEMISLDPTVLTEVDLPTLQDKWRAKTQILYARAPNINFTPRNKKKQGKSLRRDQVKRIIKQDAKKAFFNRINETKEKLLQEMNLGKKEEGIKRQKSVLDRFRSKNRSNNDKKGAGKKRWRK